MSRTARFLTTCALVFGAARVAAADPPTAQERSLARQLRQDGRALLTSGKVSDACAKLATSFSFDPDRSTLMDLAGCHEREGRIATAWQDFKNAAIAAGQAGDHTQETQAKDRAALLEKRVPHVSLTPPPGEVLAGLEVRVDGTVVDVYARTVLSVDPGRHAVAATAPGRNAWQGEVVAKDGGTETLALPKLEKLPEGDKLGVGVAQPPSEAAPPPQDSWRMPVGVTLTVVGQAALVVGTIGAVTAVAQHGGGASRDVKIVVATVGFVAGAALSTVGIVLLVAGPRPDPPPPSSSPAKAALRPSFGLFAGPATGGIWGRF